MALLPSHLPFLYCMLCYRSDRHVDRRLVDLLADSTIPESNNAPRRPSENPRINERFGRHLRDRPWIWHERNNLDLGKLCNNKSDSQRRRRTFGSRRFQDNVDSGKRKNTHRDACFTTRPDDIRQMLPNRFLTVQELMATLPREKQASEFRSQTHTRMKPLRRYTVNAGFHQDLKFFTHTHCSACYTEIGYEILSEITDFDGQNHTVLNFQNAYQFIAAGRCLNEHSPCGGGGQARCSQVFRAHWTLVWTPDKGTQLVAHEVPSHCECINLGAPLSTQEPPGRNLKRSLPTVGLDNV